MTHPTSYFKAFYYQQKAETWQNVFNRLVPTTHFSKTN